MPDRQSKSPIWMRAVALAAVVFGLITIGASGSVLAGLDRGVSGQVVPLVLWTNLLLGPVYVFAGTMLWRGSASARPLAVVIASMTALAGLGFAVLALSGTPVEPRTAAALAFRFAVWVGIAVIAPGRTT